MLASVTAAVPSNWIIIPDFNGVTVGDEEIKHLLFAMKPKNWVVSKEEKKQTPLYKSRRLDRKTGGASAASSRPKPPIASNLNRTDNLILWSDISKHVAISGDVTG